MLLSQTHRPLAVISVLTYALVQRWHDPNPLHEATTFLHREHVIDGYTQLRYRGK